MSLVVKQHQILLDLSKRQKKHLMKRAKKSKMYPKRNRTKTIVVQVRRKESQTKLKTMNLLNQDQDLESKKKMNKTTKNHLVMYGFLTLFSQNGLRFNLNSLFKVQAPVKRSRNNLSLGLLIQLSLLTNLS